MVNFFCLNLHEYLFFDETWKSSVGREAGATLQKIMNKQCGRTITRISSISIHIFRNSYYATRTILEYRVVCNWV